MMEVKRAENRVYEDFAKMRAEIEDMENGQKKARALQVWHVLVELCFGKNS